MLGSARCACSFSFRWLPVAGREIWDFRSGGKMMHVGTQRCAGVAGSPGAGAQVVPVPCDGAGAWEATPDGQLKAGDFCLSQSGVSAGSEDVALRSAAAASSTFDAVTHGAWAAVDGNGATYWASKVGERVPVELSLDFGAPRAVTTLRISWEAPAKSFSVLSSSDGTTWEELFSTSANIARNSVIEVGGRRVAKVRVVMREGSPTFEGQALYGIRSVRAVAPRLEPLLDECVAAAKTPDARDKYFLVAVASHDPAGSQTLRGELPALEAAGAALSASVSETVAVVPKLATCRRSSVQMPVLLTASSSAAAFGAAPLAAAASPAELLARAREVIVAVRARLA